MGRKPRCARLRGYRPGIQQLDFPGETEPANEESIGRGFPQRQPGKMVVLSTRAAIRQSRAAAAGPGTLRRDLAESLAHLNTDHVELYFLHRDDPRRPVGEILESLNEWVESGAVRALGASNWRASRIEEANRYAASHGLQGFTVSQIQWSLARTSPDKLGDPTLVCMTPAEYAWYREQRFPVMAYTSQAGGYFSKALSGAPLSPGDQARYGCEENSRRMERVKTICARRGVTPAAVCLAAITGKSAPRLRHRGLFLPGAAAGHPVGRLAGALAGGGGLAVGRLRGQSPGSITG